MKEQVEGEQEISLINEVTNCLDHLRVSHTE